MIIKLKETTKKLFQDFFLRNQTLTGLKESLEQAISLLFEAAKKNKILVCGNGGSAADSEHIAGELLKSFINKRQVPAEFRRKILEEAGSDGDFIADNLQMGIPCIPLTSFCAFNTAFLNDCNEKMLFAQLINALGVEGDILLAISTSGNAKNVIYAAQVAKAKGMKVIALTGSTGGKLKSVCNVLLNVPNDITYQIQELHLPLYHLLCLALENEMFGI